MGWARGSYMAEDMWEILVKAECVPKDPVKRQKLARRIINLFEDHDADDWSDDTKLYKAANPKRQRDD